MGNTLTGDTEGLEQIKEAEKIYKISHEEMVVVHFAYILKKLLRKIDEAKAEGQNFITYEEIEKDLDDMNFREFTTRLDAHGKREETMN